MPTRDSRFFIIPNMIDDADLKPSAFRLYAHLRRVCGDNRTCTEGQRLLAKRCGMSSKTIVEAKADLVKAGLITMAEISTPHGVGHEIKLVDIKELNQAVYEKGSHLQDSTGTHLAVKTAKAAQARYRDFIKTDRKAKNMPIPKDFEVTKEMREWANLNAANIDIDRETARFVEFAIAGNSQVKNWIDFWKNWLTKNAVF